MPSFEQEQTCPARYYRSFREEKNLPPLYQPGLRAFRLNNNINNNIIDNNDNNNDNNNNNDKDDSNDSDDCDDECLPPLHRSGLWAGIIFRDNDDVDDPCKIHEIREIHGLHAHAWAMYVVLMLVGFGIGHLMAHYSKPQKKWPDQSH